MQNAIWTAAINNVLYPNVFWMYSFLDPDLTHSQSARDMGAAFKSLKFEGVGKLLMESERLQDGIAIHYSMPSVHGATILGYHQRGRNDIGEGDRNASIANFPANRDGWVRVTKDLGLQFDFVSSEQMAKGSLASGKYKTLILPLSMAISPAEVKAIESFVQNGGTVIADAAAGVMNEHCSWRRSGLLNELFGISAPASDKRELKRIGAEMSVTADGPASAKLGEQPDFTITSSLPGRRLIRCHVFAPDGSFLAAYAKNVMLENATARIALPMALNDPAGEYRLRVMDVMTGAAAEARIRLN